MLRAAAQAGWASLEGGKEKREDQLADKVPNDSVCLFCRSKSGRDRFL